MPISIIVGGQYGSEGKGKVAEWIARHHRAAAVVRVGGTNSGHTAISPSGRTWALRQLPVSAIVPDTVAVLPAGAIIDPEIFMAEVVALGLGPGQVQISRFATVITADDKLQEVSAGLIRRIGSTGSGTGAALVRRIGRRREKMALAGEHPDLAPFVTEAEDFLDGILRAGGRVVIEGTQGFGLSLFHGGHYPYATSRDTTAATFLGEAGLSPRDVDDVTLVIRAFPIRVAGDSGPLKGETTWAEIARRSNLPSGYSELSTATRKIRRVGHFDAELVRRSIRANNPNSIVLNHFDYFDAHIREGRFTNDALNFLESEIEGPVGRRMNWIGTGASSLRDRNSLRLDVAPQRKAAV